jgi:hypothetical protein
MDGRMGWLVGGASVLGPPAHIRLCMTRFSDIKIFNNVLQSKASTYVAGTIGTK